MRYLSLILILALSGCYVAPFAVKQADPRFSKNPYFFSENNRVSSKNVSGGVILGSTDGFYLNPFIERDSNGDPMIIGFDIVNKSSHNTSYGDVGRIGQIDKISFLVGNELIEFDVVNKDTKRGQVTYNTVSKWASHPVLDKGKITLSQNVFKKIADKKIAIKVYGRNGSGIFEVDDILPSFKQNLKKFYSTYIIQKQVLPKPIAKNSPFPD